jgi:hypothetical protein
MGITKDWRLLVPAAFLIVSGCGWRRCAPDAGCTANENRMMGACRHGWPIGPAASMRREPWTRDSKATAIAGLPEKHWSLTDDDLVRSFETMSKGRGWTG